MTRLHAVVLLMCVLPAAARYGSEESFCSPMTLGECSNVLQYNMTIFPNIWGHISLKEAANGFEHYQFQSLIRTGCSRHLRFFLCATLAPMCDNTYKHVVRPCRPLCEHVRDSCSKVLISYGLNWPELLNCDSFLEENKVSSMCMNGEFDKSAIRPQPRPSRLQTLPSAAPVQHVCGNYRYPNRYLYINRTRRCALRCDETALFSREERHFMQSWQSAWAVLCFSCALLTVLSFAIDARRYNYPMRIMLFLALSSGLHSLGYIVRLGAGRDAISCDTEAGQRILIQEGLENTSCSIVFLLLYYFGFSSVLWWLVLCLACLLHLGLGWSAERIERYTSYWHLGSWALPAVQTIVILVTRAVDGDELSGTCYVGNQSDRSLLGFVIIPLAVYVTLGALLLGAQLTRRRSSQDAPSVTNSSTSRGPSMVRSSRETSREGCGRRALLLCVLLLVAFSCVLITYIYEYCTRSTWLRRGNAHPKVELFYFRVLMTLIIGGVCAFGVASHKTLASWQQCCRRSCRMQERTKYHPPSAQGASEGTGTLLSAPYRGAYQPPGQYNTSVSSFAANDHRYVVRSANSSLKHSKGSGALV